MIMQEKIAQLAKEYPWPSSKPELEFNDSGWFPACNQEVLGEYLSNDTKVVLELGSWVGLSTRWILDHAPNATVIAVDHWEGSPENKDDPLLPILYDQFLTNCWKYKSRLIPMKSKTTDALKKLKDMNMEFDVIYVDAGHDYYSARDDLENTRDFECARVGDDFNPNTWPGVVRAAWEESNNSCRRLIVRGSAWVIPAK